MTGLGLEPRMFTLVDAKLKGHLHLFPCLLWNWKFLSFSCVFCDPMDCSPPGSSVRGILQTWILEWAVLPFSKGSSWPRDWTWVSGTAGRFSIVWATREFLVNFHTLYSLTKKILWLLIVLGKIESFYLGFCGPIQPGPLSCSEFPTRKPSCNWTLLGVP